MPPSPPAAPSAAPAVNSKHQQKKQVPATESTTFSIYRQHFSQSLEEACIRYERNEMYALMKCTGLLLRLLRRRRQLRDGQVAGPRGRCKGCGLGAAAQKARRW